MTPEQEARLLGLEHDARRIHTLYYGAGVRFFKADADAVAALLAEVVRLREALGRIAEDRCGPKPVGFTPSAETRLSLAKAEARAALSTEPKGESNG